MITRPEFLRRMGELKAKELKEKREELAKRIGLFERRKENLRADLVAQEKFAAAMAKEDGK